MADDEVAVPSKCAERFANLIMRVGFSGLDETDVAAIIGCSPAEALRMLENAQAAGILEQRIEVVKMPRAKEGA